MNHSSITPELLQKYLHEECTDFEKAAIENWYASLKGIPYYLDTLSEKERSSLQTETFRRIQQDLAPQQTNTSFRLSPLRGQSMRWWVSIAASVVLLAGGWFWYGKTGLSAVTMEAAQPAPPAVAPADLIRFVNEEPRMVMHTLPDGSTVWLHAGAILTYPAAFAVERRLVGFEGEGFFDVKSDKKRPFVIQSGEMKVEVLGTRFNVKAPPKEMIYEVSVVSGSVAVSASHGATATHKVILAPQQQALFEIQNKRLTSNILPQEPRKEIYEPVTILFESTPLHRVIDQLGKRFDVRVHLVNPDMKSCHLTADFEQQTLPAILEMLCATLDATYTMSGKTILIEGDACD
jgi:transmembrane sensor